MVKFDYEGMVHRGEVAKRKAMIAQINNKGEIISVFNARKSLYVPIDDSFLGRIIKFLIKIMVNQQLKVLNERSND